MYTIIIIFGTLNIDRIIITQPIGMGPKIE